MWTILFLVAAAFVVLWVVSSQRATVSVKSEDRMVALNLEPGSSYEQRTNHFQMTPVDMGPISGSETPFRVNLYNAYMD